MELANAGTAGPGREAYASRWSDGAPMRLVVCEREDATQEFFLDWNTRTGRASLSPEGRATLPRERAAA